MCNSTAFLVGVRGIRYVWQAVPREWLIFGSGLWVFCVLTQFHCQNTSIFLDLMTVFWGSVVCLPRSLDTFLAKKLQQPVDTELKHNMANIHQIISVLIHVVYVETKWQCQDYAIVQ